MGAIWKQLQLVLELQIFQIALEYKFTAGDGNIYTKGTGKTLEFTATGDHTIAVVYGDREAKAGFQIVAAAEEVPKPGTSGADTTKTGTSSPTATTNPGISTQTSVKPLTFKQGSYVTSQSQTVSPKTGDSNKTVLWIVLMLVACGGIGAVCVCRKKRGFFHD